MEKQTISDNKSRDIKCIEEYMHKYAQIFMYDPEYLDGPEKECRRINDPDGKIFEDIAAGSLCDDVGISDGE